MGWELNVYHSWQGGSPTLPIAHHYFLLVCGCQLCGRAASLRYILRSLPTAQLPKMQELTLDQLFQQFFSPYSRGTLHSHLLLGSPHPMPALWRWSSGETTIPGHLQCPLDSQKIKGLLLCQMVGKQAASLVPPLSAPCLPVSSFSKLQPHQALYHFNGLPKFRRQREGEASLTHLEIISPSPPPPTPYIDWGNGGEGRVLRLPSMGRWLALVLLVL